MENTEEGFIASKEEMHSIVSTHQPIFLPWPGFFLKAWKSDILVLLDEVAFPLGRSWMGRNRLKDDRGELWLTVPIRRKGRSGQVIRDTEIYQETHWRKKHLRGLQQMYAHAPYTDDYLPELESIYRRPYNRLVDFNLALIRFLLKAVGVQVRLVLQSELGVSGQGTELLVDITRAVGADTFVALSAAGKYLDGSLFSANNIELQLSNYKSPVYPQLWGSFIYNLSIVDLLCNCGPNTLEIILKSQRSFLSA